MKTISPKLNPIPNTNLYIVTPSPIAVQVSSNTQFNNGIYNIDPPHSKMDSSCITLLKNIPQLDEIPIVENIPKLDHERVTNLHETPENIPKLDETLSNPVNEKKEPTPIKKKKQFTKQPDLQLPPGIDKIIGQMKAPMTGVENMMKSAEIEEREQFESDVKFQKSLFSMKL
jgi:hypothetical protein